MKVESVWDYPRPPALEKSESLIKIIYKDIIVAESKNTYRVLETSHPPNFYMPQSDIKMELFSPSRRNTFCEWKGKASYWNLNLNDKVFENVAWSYPDPTENFTAIKDYLSFYPGELDCYVDNEKVKAETGKFYGGWITKNIKL